MPILIKSLREPTEAKDGCRILITRYRPRGVRNGEETWREWDKRLAPSVELLDRWYGKRREGRTVVDRNRKRISWNEYAEQFLEEMQKTESQKAIHETRQRATGETITLLCFCDDEVQCHRALVLRLATTEEVSRSQG